MPKKETENNSDKKPQKSISDSDGLSTHSVSPHASKESVAGDSPTHQRHDINKPRSVNIPKIDVAEDTEANKIAKSANSISRWSVFVSALLFGITLLIAYQAIKQSKAASDSVALARQTYLADSVYKHKNDSLSKISDSVKKAHEDTAFNAQKAFYTNAKRGVDAQIQAVKTQQGAFEIENRPLVQIIDFHFDTLSSGKQIMISFYFRNYGKQPVKCLTSKYAVDFQPGIKYREKQNINWNDEIMNSYLTNSNASFSSWKTAGIATQQEVNEIYNGYISTYIFGSLFYQNTVTSQKWEFRFNFRMRYIDHQFGAEGLVDTAIVIK